MDQNTTTELQVQLHEITPDGHERNIMPMNSSADVRVGSVPGTGELKLPGETGINETLETTLTNIKKFLSNLKGISAQAIELTDDCTSTSSTKIPTAKAVSDVNTALGGLAEKVREISGEVETSVPTNHASENTTYGIGTSSKYGHTKLSDVYASGVVNGSADNGMGASQKALFDAYTALHTSITENTTAIGGKSPNMHSATDTTYGGGTGSAFGHVKLSDDYTDETTASASGASASMGASSYALHAAYSSLKSMIDAGSMPTNHASTVASTYGAGTANYFGHVKLSDNYKTSDGSAAGSVGASSYAVNAMYQDLSEEIKDITEKVIVPEFHVDLETMHLIKEGGAGYDFVLQENGHLCI